MIVLITNITNTEDCKTRHVLEVSAIVMGNLIEAIK